jgi:Domain of unknown function (DUF3806)
MSRERIDPLSEHEIEWITSQLAAAAEMAGRCSGKRERLPGPDSLDAVARAWRSCAPSERESAERMADALGLAFGHNLVETLGLEWVLISDDAGTVIGLAGPGEIRVRPIALAARCLASGEGTSFAASFDCSCSEIRAAVRS